MTIKNTYGEEFNVIPSTYKENENKYKLNSVFAAGMCYYSSEWLNDHGIAEDATEDVFNNTSGLRDGNSVTETGLIYTTIIILIMIISVIRLVIYGRWKTV